MRGTSSHTVYPLVLLGVFALQPTAAQDFRLSEARLANIRSAAHGVGVSAFDFNQDGWPDLTIAARQGGSGVFQNRGDGTFQDVSHLFDLQDTVDGEVPLWADVNGDGLPDLFLGEGHMGRSRLLVAQPDGTWRDEAVALGIDTTLSVASAAFGDYDRDGRVDLFLAVLGGKDVLYHNRGTQGFVDVTDFHEVGGDPSTKPMQAVWFDYDLDGDPDLLATHDLDVESRLHLNEGVGVWEDIAPRNGLAYVGPGSSMGVAWGDPNLDGHPDAYISRIEYGGLYMNRGNGTFSDEAPALGGEVNGVSWGVLFLDMDNDQDEDLFVASTVGWNNTPPMLWRNEGAYLHDTGTEYIRNSKGAAAADFNHDGRIDIALVNTLGEHRVLVNETPTTNNWVGIRLVGRQGNRPAIGARVEIRAGGKTMRRVLSGGDSYNSQSSNILHFGLGTSTDIESVMVWWPNGLRQPYSPTDVEVNQINTVAADGATSIEPAAATEFGFGYVYPNPTTGPLQVGYQGGTVSVIDILGRQVFRLRQGASHMDLGHLAAGSYLIRLSDGQRRVHKVIVLR